MVDELNDYKIVQRTNVITYQKRLKAFQEKQTMKNTNTDSSDQFKRWTGVPSLGCESDDYEIYCQQKTQKYDQNKQQS